MMRIVHYVNQFFGGLGGEAAADAPFTVKEGPVGPGKALANQLGDEAEIVATLICGDNTANNSESGAAEEAARQAEHYEADVAVAGPAFQSGRYGLSCAAVADAVYQAGRPAVVAMHAENPGVSLCPAAVPVVHAGENATDMLATLERLVPVIHALAAGEPLSREAREGCVCRNIRHNVFDSQPGAVRAIEMLMDKLHGRPYRTEIQPPRFPPIEPAPGLGERPARIALVTTGGLVPHGNPDRLEASSASKWIAYSIAGRAFLTPEDFECIHAGIDTAQVNQDPNRLVPLDVCRELESEGAIESVHSLYYVTVGNLTPVAKAEYFATEIAGRLCDSGIEGVILTST